MDAIMGYLSQLGQRLPSALIYGLGITAAAFFASMWQRLRLHVIDPPWVVLHPGRDPNKLRFNLFLLLSLLAPLLITAFRSGVGTDYNTYIANYHWIASSGGVLNFILHNGLLEPGYVFITWASQFLGGYPVMFALCGFITIAGFYRGITYHADKISIGTATFLFMCLYFQMSLNIVRQFMAAGLLFCAVWYMLRQRPRPFLIFVVAAAMFHISALVMLPFYFFASDKKWARIFRLVVIAGICLVFISWPLISKAMPYIPVISRFAVYAYPAGPFKPDMLAFSLPLVLPVLIFRKKLITFNPDNRVLIDLILIGSVFANFKYLSEPLSRLALYFLTAQILVLPSFVYVMKTRRQKMIAWALVILYGIGYWGLYYFLFNRAETFPFVSL